MAAMAKCKMCGCEIHRPLKSWVVGKSHIGLFVCPMCGFSFKGGLGGGAQGAGAKKTVEGGG